MKTVLSLSRRGSHLLACCAFMFALPALGADTNNDDKWYEKSFSELLDTKIVTATRSDKALIDSPSNITIYTADDIQRMGIRTIKELLERTQGFFVNKQVSGPMMGSRGYVGDNEQFLLLIDGHNANSIVDKGPGYFFMFPFLEHIERVEIQRGPGSTLWGSDAALGIIHLITKDGAAIDGTKVTVSNSSEDNLRSANVQMGEEISPSIDIMASLSFAKADGYIIQEDGINNGVGGRWEYLHDSWEMYVKANVGDYKVYARATDLKNVRPARSLGPSIEEAAIQRRRHMYIDIGRDFVVNDRLQIETRLFSDLMERWQELLIPISTPDVERVEESYGSREHSLGFELLARWQPHDDHRMLFGYRGVNTEIDPATATVTYPQSYEPSSTPADYYMRVIPEEADKNNALFWEDDWQIIDETLNMVFGLRLDNNSLREDSTIVLPRFATVWAFQPAWRIKYAYNTGYIRPPVGIGFLGQSQFNVFPGQASGEIYGADKSEEVFNHDVQLSFNNSQFSSSLSLYHMTVDNAFNFLFATDSQGRTLFYINTNEITSYGYELDFRYSPGQLSVYGNFSHVLESKIDSQQGSNAGIDYDLSTSWVSIFDSEDTLVGYPHLMWNLGVDYAIQENLSLNVHYRAWDEIYTRRGDTGSKAYGPEHFFDMNFSYLNIAGSGIDASVFVKNLLDNNDAETPQLFFDHNWQPLGRSIGAELSFSF